MVDDPSILPRPVSIFDSTGDSLPLVITSDPSQVYSRRPRLVDPLPTSSPDSGISLPPLSCPELVLPRYPTRVRRPPARFLLSNSSHHPISKFVSYQGLSASYQSFLSQVDSVPIPRSVHEALQDPQWVVAM